MSRLTLGELFAGYGGLGLAVEEVFRAELSWYAEFDDAPSKVLAHHWPGVTNHRDVTKIDWTQVEPVDIISGGSPCQDLSTAGRRAGMTEGTRSNLWVSMREAIAVIKPKYVVWENVRGAYSAKAVSSMEQCPGCLGEARPGEHSMRALGRILSDLADLGFNAEWRGIRASDVGAPHLRYRVFILATRRAEFTYTDNDGLERQHYPFGAAQADQHRHAIAGTSVSDRRTTIAHADSFRSRGGHDAPGESAQGGQDTKASFANGRFSQSRAVDWGVYRPAIERWEQVRGIPAPNPTEVNDKTGKHRLASAFTEWMMGLAPGHVTGVPGISRNEQLKMLGNGVVPQQAVLALKDMLK